MWATRFLAGAIGHGGLPFMIVLRAEPPNFFTRRSSQRFTTDGTILSWVQLSGDIGKFSGQAIFLTGFLISAIGATTSVSSSRNFSLPFMLAIIAT
jgi:hypothetical protein